MAAMALAQALVPILANTQLGDKEKRLKAEGDLKLIEATNPNYALALVTVASTQDKTEIRQSALSVLRYFVERNKERP